MIGWLANEETSTQAPGVSSTLSSVGQEVIERIKKCFARAYHPNSNENEARAAVKMASKIMEQYKINQADLMEQEDQSHRAERGGMSTVNILPAKEDGVVRAQTWVSDLVSAVCKFFDCNAYSSMLEDMIEWTFYGVVEHTVSAGIALEMIHNLIQEWAGSYKTIATRNSYSLGVADGLCRLADDDKEALEKAARDTEAKALAARLHDEDIQQQKELDRLRNPPPPPSPSPPSSPPRATDRTEYPSYNPYLDGFGTDADSDYDNESMPDFNEEQRGAAVDVEADFDTELQNFIIPKREAEPDPEPDHPAEQDGQLSPADPPCAKSPSPIKQENEDPNETAEWKSMHQLTVFRQNLKDIEDSVLKAKGVKLSKGRRKKRSVKDREIFRQGRKDAGKINVRAARIEVGKSQTPVEIGETGTGGSVH